MSVECPRAAAVSRSSTARAGQPALARSALTRVATSVSNSALPDGWVPVGLDDAFGVLGFGVLGFGVWGFSVLGAGAGSGGAGAAVAVAPGSPDSVAVGAGAGGVPSVVITSLSMSGATPTGLLNPTVLSPSCSVATMRSVPGRPAPRVAGNGNAMATAPLTLTWAVRA